MNMHDGAVTLVISSTSSSGVRKDWGRDLPGYREGEYTPKQHDKALKDRFKSHVVASSATFTPLKTGGKIDHDHQPHPPAPVKRTADYHLRDLHHEGEWGHAGHNPRYGAVTFDTDGRVLLREPTNHFDGYHWTLPKGGPDEGEHPVHAALRETVEETGYRPTIVGHVPGEGFGGSATGSKNFFYLAEQRHDSPAFDRFAAEENGETQGLTWAKPEDAMKLIGMSKNAKGRYRDQQTLKAAVDEYSRLHPEMNLPKLPEPVEPPKPSYPKPLSSTSHHVEHHHHGGKITADDLEAAGALPKKKHSKLAKAIPSWMKPGPKTSQADADFMKYLSNRVVGSISFRKDWGRDLKHHGGVATDVVGKPGQAIGGNYDPTTYDASLKQEFSKTLAAARKAAGHAWGEAGAKAWHEEHPGVAHAGFADHWAAEEHKAHEELGKRGIDKAFAAHYIEHSSKGYKIGAQEHLDSTQIAAKSAPHYAKAKKAIAAGDHEEAAKELGLAHGIQQAAREKKAAEKAQGIAPHKHVAGGKGQKVVHSTTKFTAPSDAKTVNPVGISQVDEMNAHLHENPHLKGSSDWAHYENGYKLTDSWVNKPGTTPEQIEQAHKAHLDEAAKNADAYHQGAVKAIEHHYAAEGKALSVQAKAVEPHHDPYAEGSPEAKAFHVTEDWHAGQGSAVLGEKGIHNMTAEHGSYKYGATVYEHGTGGHTVVALRQRIGKNGKPASKWNVIKQGTSTGDVEDAKGMAEAAITKDIAKQEGKKAEAVDHAGHHFESWDDVHNWAGKHGITVDQAGLEKGNHWTPSDMEDVANAIDEADEAEPGLASKIDRISHNSEFGSGARVIHSGSALHPTADHIELAIGAKNGHIEQMAASGKSPGAPKNLHEAVLHEMGHVKEASTPWLRHRPGHGLTIAKSVHPEMKRSVIKQAAIDAGWAKPNGAMNNDLVKHDLSTYATKDEGELHAEAFAVTHRKGGTKDLSPETQERIAKFHQSIHDQTAALSAKDEAKKAPSEPEHVEEPEHTEKWDLKPQHLHGSEIDTWYKHAHGMTGYKNGKPVEHYGVTQVPEGLTTALSHHTVWKHTGEPEPTHEPHEHMPTSSSDLAKMKKVSGPLGSNGGQWYEDEHGQQYLVKPAQSADHAYNEVGMGKVYESAGIAAPHTSVLHGDDGKTYVVSKKMEGLKPWTGSESEKAQARAGMGVDALTANHDVAGLSMDNVFTDKDGKLVRVDIGGAGKYRAMGGKKATWDKEVVEDKSMLTSDQGKKLYGHPVGTTTPGYQGHADVTKSLHEASNVDLADVAKRMEAAGVPEPARQEMLERLAHRQSDIKNHLGAEEEASKVLASTSDGGHDEQFEKLKGESAEAAHGQVAMGLKDGTWDALAGQQWVAKNKAEARQMHEAGDHEGEAIHAGTAEGMQKALDEHETEHAEAPEEAAHEAEAPELPKQVNPEHADAYHSGFAEGYKEAKESGMTAPQLKAAISNKGHKKSAAALKAGDEESHARYYGIAHGYRQAYKEKLEAEHGASKVQESTSEATKPDEVADDMESGYQHAEKLHHEGADLGEIHKQAFDAQEAHPQFAKGMHDYAQSKGVAEDAEERTPEHGTTYKQAHDDAKASMHKVWSDSLASGKYTPEDAEQFVQAMHGVAESNHEQGHHHIEATVAGQAEGAQQALDEYHAHGAPGSQGVAIEAKDVKAGDVVSFPTGSNPETKHTVESVGVGAVPGDVKMDTTDEHGNSHQGIHLKGTQTVLHHGYATKVEASTSKAEENPVGTKWIPKPEYGTDYWQKMPDGSVKAFHEDGTPFIGGDGKQLVHEGGEKDLDDDVAGKHSGQIIGRKEGPGVAHKVESPFEPTLDAYKSQQPEDYMSGYEKAAKADIGKSPAELKKVLHIHEQSMGSPSTDEEDKADLAGFIGAHLDALNGTKEHRPKYVEDDEPPGASVPEEQSELHDQILKAKNSETPAVKKVYADSYKAGKTYVTGHPDVAPEATAHYAHLAEGETPEVGTGAQYLGMHAGMHDALHGSDQYAPGTPSHEVPVTVFGYQFNKDDAQKLHDAIQVGSGKSVNYHAEEAGVHPLNAEKINGNTTWNSAAQPEESLSGVFKKELGKQLGIEEPASHGDRLKLTEAAAGKNYADSFNDGYNQVAKALGNGKTLEEAQNAVDKYDAEKPYHTAASTKQGGHEGLVAGGKQAIADHEAGKELHAPTAEEVKQAAQAQGYEKKPVKKSTSVMAKNLKPGDIVKHPYGGGFIKVESTPHGTAPGTLHGQKFTYYGQHMGGVEMPMEHGGQTKVSKLTSIHPMYDTLQKSAAEAAGEPMPSAPTAAATTVAKPAVQSSTSVGLGKVKTKAQPIKYTGDTLSNGEAFHQHPGYHNEAYDQAYNEAKQTESPTNEKIGELDKAQKEAPLGTEEAAKAKGAFHGMKAAQLEWAKTHKSEAQKQQEKEYVDKVGSAYTSKAPFKVNPALSKEVPDTIPHGVKPAHATQASSVGYDQAIAQGYDQAVASHLEGATPEQINGTVQKYLEDAAAMGAPTDEAGIMGQAHLAGLAQGAGKAAVDMKAAEKVGKPITEAHPNASSKSIVSQAKAGDASGHHAYDSYQSGNPYKDNQSDTQLSFTPEEQHTIGVWKSNYRESNPNAPFIKALDKLAAGHEAGSSQAAKSAKHMMSMYVEHAEPNKQPFQRKLKSHGMPAHILKELTTEGGTVDIPISSWSTDPNAWSGDLWLHAPPGTVSMDIGRIVNYSSEVETVSGGQFHVDKVEKKGGTTHVYLTQTEAFFK